MKTTTDLLMLRWRATQWALALGEGDTVQAGALLQAMHIEGVERADLVDEYALLRAQFGHRPRYVLAAEADRLAQRLGVGR